MRRQRCWLTLFSVLTLMGCTFGVVPPSDALDVDAIGIAAGTTATAQADGVVRIGWSRSDVEVHVDGMPFKPQAGLGSWAAFKESPKGAMVMGDTVVFQDEVDAAMDAAFAGGLEVTALHNHFFYDDPKVYFMHIGGQGDPVEMASGVKGMWDAIKNIRKASPIPAKRFPGDIPADGSIDASVIEGILGVKGKVNNGVVKVAFPREGMMHGVPIGGTMGLSSWAAYSGSDDLAAMDGDFIMTADEVQPVLHAMRQRGIHVVALHNHMTNEEPHFYFTHFWATGSVEKLSHDFKFVLDAQAAVQMKSAKAAKDKVRFDFDAASAGELDEHWHVEGTNQSGALATWKRVSDSTTLTRPNVLALTHANHTSNGTFNICWNDTVSFKDGTISLRFKANAGRVDQGGGPIWRVMDKDNYYICRANPLEDNIRLYYVKKGSRRQLASAKVAISSGEWHSIFVRHKGSHIECYFNGRKLLEADDSTFTDVGTIGVWTKADAVTSFDDITVTL